MIDLARIDSHFVLEYLILYLCSPYYTLLVWWKTLFNGEQNHFQGWIQIYISFPLFDTTKWMGKDGCMGERNLRNGMVDSVVSLLYKRITVFPIFVSTHVIIVFHCINPNKGTWKHFLLQRAILCQIKYSINILYIRLTKCMLCVISFCQFGTCLNWLIYLCTPEEDPLPGRPVPLECHAELHTDYDGPAVRWGLTHHKESAADCCQACLDQARRAKPGDKKCNIWVYCPSESGCYSPDIYEHKHQECWLKYVSNFDWCFCWKQDVFCALSWQGLSWYRLFWCTIIELKYFWIST